MRSSFLLGILTLSLISPQPADAGSQGCDYHTLVDQRIDAEDENSFTNIWAIQSPNGAQGFVVGTQHTTDKRVVSAYEGLSFLIHRADVYFPEVDLDQRATTEFLKASKREHDRDLEALLGPGVFDRLKDIAEERSLSVDDLSSQTNWFLISTLSRPNVRGSSIDQVLWGHANRLGKEIIPLESMDQLIGAMESISPQSSASILSDVICNYSQIQDQAKRLVKYYGEQEWSLWRQEIVKNQSADDNLNDEFHARLITERNLRMVDTVHAHTKANDRFVVSVGLSHLIGEDGLISLFYRKGYKVFPLSWADIQDQIRSVANKYISDNRATFIHLYHWIEHLGRFGSLPPIGVKDLPKIQFLSQQEMQDLACEGRRCPVEGFYNSGVLAINQKLFTRLVSKNTHAMGIVLHELVHWAQEKWGGYGGEYGRCNNWREREIEAYSLQYQYLTVHGVLPRAMASIPPPVACEE